MNKNTLLIIAALGAVAVLILVVTYFRQPPSTGLPAASNLTAVNQADAASPSIKLDWKDNSSGESGYKVYRKPTGDTTAAFALVTTTAANVTTYTDSGLTQFWEYSFKVNATSATGDSPDSNIASAQALMAATPPPTTPPGDAISVKDRGAKGDGTTDDKTAIQNVVNECPMNGTILFPAGVYKLSGPLSLKGSCNYMGEGGATLQGHTGTGSGAYLLARTQGSGIKIQGLTFDAGGIELPVDMQSNITITQCKFQNIVNCNGCVSGVAAFGPTTAGIWIGATLLKSTISHNQFYNIMDGGNNNITDGQMNGLRGWRLSEVSITDNVFDLLQQGLSISESQESEMTLPEYKSDVIARNVFTRIKRMPIEIQHHRFKDLLIEDNKASKFLGPYWNTFGVSMACDGTGTIVRRNEFDARGAANAGGYCIEAGCGPGAVYDSNKCLNATGAQWNYGVVVAYAPNGVVINNTLCGGFRSGHATSYEPPHVEGFNPPKPVTFTNNSTASTCP